jgi:hypothetical protein
MRKNRSGRLKGRARGSGTSGGPRIARKIAQERSPPGALEPAAPLAVTPAPGVSIAPPVREMNFCAVLYHQLERLKPPTVAWLLLVAMVAATVVICVAGKGALVVTTVGTVGGLVKKLVSK